MVVVGPGGVSVVVGRGPGLRVGTVYDVVADHVVVSIVGSTDSDEGRGTLPVTEDVGDPDPPDVRSHPATPTTQNTKATTAPAVRYRDRVLKPSSARISQPLLELRQFFDSS